MYVLAFIFVHSAWIAGFSCGYRDYLFARAEWLLTYAQKLTDFAEFLLPSGVKTALEEENKIVKKMMNGRVDKIALPV